MTNQSDLETMIEILGLAITRQETEEHFFRRSAEASTSDVAKSLFNEVAEDLRKYHSRLEERRNELLNRLDAP